MQGFNHPANSTELQRSSSSAFSPLKPKQNFDVLPTIDHDFSPSISKSTSVSAQTSGLQLLPSMTQSSQGLVIPNQVESVGKSSSTSSASTSVQPSSASFTVRGDDDHAPKDVAMKHNSLKRTRKHDCALLMATETMISGLSSGSSEASGSEVSPENSNATSSSGGTSIMPCSETCVTSSSSSVAAAPSVQPCRPLPRRSKRSGDSGCSGKRRWGGGDSFIDVSTGGSGACRYQTRRHCNAVDTQGSTTTEKESGCWQNEEGHIKQIEGRSMISSRQTRKHRA